MSIGTFLRTRRECLSPPQVGINSANARRRTPGLRREEVALLAGISPEWYTYLEQDRAVTPSLAVIDRIAIALQLSWAESEYLRHLALPRATISEPCDALPAGLQAYMDDLEHRPAYVVNDVWDIVGWNSVASAVFPIAISATQFGEQHPNLVLSIFLNHAWRKLYKDWEQSARKMLALFRLTVAGHANHERCKLLLSELNSASAEFNSWWRAQDVATTTTGTKNLVHPRVGELSVAYASFRTTDDPSLTMITFRPHDLSSKEKLLALAAS